MEVFTSLQTNPKILNRNKFEKSKTFENRDTCSRRICKYSKYDFLSRRDLKARPFYTFIHNCYLHVLQATLQVYQFTQNGCLPHPALCPQSKQVFHPISCSTFWELLNIPIRWQYPFNYQSPMYEPSSNVWLAFQRMASALMHGFNVLRQQQYNGSGGRNKKIQLQLSFCSNIDSKSSNYPLI